MGECQTQMIDELVGILNVLRQMFAVGLSGPEMVCTWIYGATGCHHILPLIVVEGPSPIGGCHSCLLEKLTLLDILALRRWKHR